MSLLSWWETFEAWCDPILEKGRLAAVDDGPLLFERWTYFTPPFLRLSYMCIAVLYFQCIVPKALQCNPYLRHFFGVPLYVILVPLYFIYCTLYLFVFSPIVYPLILVWLIFIAAITDNDQIQRAYIRMTQEGESIQGTISHVQTVIGNPSKQIVRATYNTHNGVTYETTPYILRQDTPVDVGSKVELIWIPSEPLSGYPASLLRAEKEGWNPRQAIAYWGCTFVPFTVLYYGSWYLYFHLLYSGSTTNSFFTPIFAGLIASCPVALDIINIGWYDKLEKKYQHCGNGARFMARRVMMDEDEGGVMKSNHSSYIL